MFSYFVINKNLWFTRHSDNTILKTAAKFKYNNTWIPSSPLLGTRHGDGRILLQNHRSRLKVSDTCKIHPSQLVIPNVETTRSNCYICRYDKRNQLWTPCLKKKYYLLSFFAIAINQALVTFEKTKKLNGQPGSGKIKTELQPFPCFNVQCHAPFSLLQFVFKARHSKLNQWKHKEI